MIGRGIGMKYKVRMYDCEMAIIQVCGEWESESAMLNELMKNGYKPIEWWEMG